MSADLFTLVSSHPLEALLKALENADADVNAVDYDKRSPLHVAATTGRLEILEVLVNKGANVNARDRWGRTPADDAMAANQSACVEFLRQRGAKLEKPRMLKQISFMPASGSIQEFLTACANNDTGTLMRMIANGFMVNTTDSDKRTGAHVAASEGHLEVLRLLHDHGANFNMVDRWGNRCIDDAERADQTMCVTFLKSQGAISSPRPEQAGDMPVLQKAFSLGDASPEAMMELHRRGVREFWSWSATDFKMDPEPFAKGAGGEVFYCKFRSLRCVAKTCGKLQTNAQTLKDLGTEISLMASMRHPNICLFFGACFQTSPPVILMELCEGGSLETRIVRAWAENASAKQRITPAQRIKYALEFAQGMTFLHEFPIPVVHRDLKPSNVLITAYDTIKIADFGLAKYVPWKNDESAAQGQTDTYKLTGGTGSYRYMAPEVYRHESYDTSVDVYSYSLIIYWMYTGLRPYGAVPDPVKAAHLAATEHLRPSVGMIKTQEKVGPFLQRCWSRNPKERPRFSEICSFFEDAKEQLGSGGMFGTLRKSVAIKKKDDVGAGEAGGEDDKEQSVKTVKTTKTGDAATTATTVKRKKSIFGL